MSEINLSIAVTRDGEKVLQMYDQHMSPKLTADILRSLAEEIDPTAKDNLLESSYPSPWPHKYPYTQTFNTNTSGIRSIYSSEAGRRGDGRVKEEGNPLERLHQARAARDHARKLYESAIIYAHQCGLGNSKIARVMGVSEAGIRMYLKRRGYTVREPKDK